MVSYGYARDKVEISLNISKKFNNIFDLGYALVDLQALITSINYVTFEKSGYKTLPVTSRTFAIKYRDELYLKEFSEGSFKSELIGSVIAGLIVLFVEKYYDSTKTITPQPPPVVAKVNVVHHYNIDNSRTFNVRCHDDNVRKKINKIIQRTKVIPGNPEVSTKNLIDEINSSDILGDHKIPIEEQGVKAISNSVERFTKSME